MGCVVSKLNDVAAAFVEDQRPYAQVKKEDFVLGNAPLPKTSRRHHQDPTEPIGSEDVGEDVEVEDVGEESDTTKSSVEDSPQNQSPINDSSESDTCSQETENMYKKYKEGKDDDDSLEVENLAEKNGKKTGKVVKRNKETTQRKKREVAHGKDAEEAAVIGDCDVEYPLLANVVRIFTSSTFTDTRSERNALMENVYPGLKEFCQERGYNFEVVDMRWGVRDEATDDHMTSDLCMREIQNCQNESTGPNFVTFLGQKYGYRPFPPKILADEFEALLERVNNTEDKDLLMEWFKRDENVEPPHYLLQPIREKLPDYTNDQEPDKKKAARNAWWAAFEKIQTVLKEASSKALQDEDDVHKYYWAVTEEEIHNGILKAENLSETTFWFRRTIIDMEENLSSKTARRFMDMKGNELDVEALDLLSKLRQEVSDCLPPESIKSYQVHWTDPGIDPAVSEEHKEYINQFCKDFKETLERMITEGITKRGENMVSSSTYEEYIAHLQLAQKKNDVFHGRSDLIEMIKSKLLKKKGKGKPLVLTGAAGSGKTSLVAKVTTQARKWMDGVAVIARFMGTTTQSSTTRDLLLSLSKQISQLENGDLKPDIPTTYKELVIHFKTQLEQISTPTCIILDSLDQLRDKGCNLRDWIPETLNNDVTLVLSTITGGGSKIKEHLEAFLSEDCFLPVPPLRPEDSQTILRHWFQEEGRTVTNQQMSLMTKACQQVKLPLFCKIAFDQACRWKSYTPLDLCHLGQTVDEVINDRFETLEKYHGKTLVQHTLAYITSAKSGVSSTELEDILSLDDVALNDVYQYHTPPLRRLPPLLVIRIQGDVREFLVTSGADGVRVLRWYHRQFQEVATRRYLSQSDFRKQIHQNLIDYFLGKWSGGVMKPYTDKKGKSSSADRFVAKQPLNFSDKVSTGLYNLRKMSELPYHLVMAGDLEGLKEHIFMNFEWLYNKTKAVGIDGIVDDYRMAQDQNVKDKELETLGKALKLSRRVVMFDVHQLPLQLWGRLGKVDSTQNPQIHKLLHQAQNPPFPCLTTTQGFMAEGDSAMEMRIAGHEEKVDAFAIRDDYNEMLTCSGDQTVRLWDLRSGRETKKINIDETEAYLPGSNIPLVNIYYCNKNKAAVMVFGTIVHKIDLERECHAAKWEFKGEEPNELVACYTFGNYIYAVATKDINVIDIKTWKKVSEVKVPHKVKNIDPDKAQKLKSYLAGHGDHLVFHRAGMPNIQVCSTKEKQVSNMEVVAEEEAQTVIIRFTTTKGGRLVGYILRYDNSPMMTYTGEFLIIDIISKAVVKRITNVECGSFLTFEILFSMDDKTVLFTRHPGGKSELSACDLDAESITTITNMGFTYITRGKATPDGRIFITYMTDVPTVECLDYRKLAKGSGEGDVSLSSAPMMVRGGLPGRRFHYYDTIDGKLGIWDVVRKRAVRQGYPPGAAMFLKWLDEERMVGMGYSRDGNPSLQAFHAVTGECILKSRNEIYKPLDSSAYVGVLDKHNVVVQGATGTEINIINVESDKVVNSISASDSLTKTDLLGGLAVSVNKRFAICFKVADPSKPQATFLSNLYVFDLKKKKFMGDMPKKTSAALSSHGLSFGQAAFTPDGDTYLTVVYTQDGGKVGAAHLPTRKWREIKNPPYSYPSHLGCSPSMDAVIVAYSGKHLIAYSMQNLEAVREVNIGCIVNSIVVSPNGAFVAIRPNEQQSCITIVDMLEGEILSHYLSDTESSGYGWSSDSCCLLVAVKGINHLVQFLLHGTTKGLASLKDRCTTDLEYTKKMSEFDDIFGEPKECNYMAYD